MAQLIEADSSLILPSEIRMTRGDLLLLKASGGHVLSGKNVMERLGPYMTALLQEDGTSLAPMGAPNTILFLAREEGNSKIDVVAGDPWHSPQTTAINIIVGP